MGFNSAFKGLIIKVDIYWFPEQKRRPYLSKSALFLATMQRVVVIPYRHFETINGPYRSFRNVGREVQLLAA